MNTTNTHSRTVLDLTSAVIAPVDAAPDLVWHFAPEHEEKLVAMEVGAGLRAYCGYLMDDDVRKVDVVRGESVGEGRDHSQNEGMFCQQCFLIAYLQMERRL